MTMKKFGRFQSAFHLVGVRIAHHRIGPKDHQALELAFPDGLDLLHHGESRRARQLGVPGFFKFCHVFRHGHVLVAGQDIGQGAHVAGPLDVVLAADGIDPGGRPPDMAAEHGEIGQALDVVGAGGVLGDPQDIDNGAGLRFGIPFGHLYEFRLGDPGDLGHPLRWELLDHLHQSG